MAAPTFVQGISEGATASSTTIADTLPGSVTAGNLIAVWVGWEDVDTTCTVSDGTTTLTAGTRGNSGGAYGQWHYLLSANSGTRTYTATFGSSVPFRGLLIQEFNSTDGAWSLDDEAAGGGSGTACTAGPITTTGTSVVAIAGAKHYSSGTFSGETIGGVSATVPAHSPENTVFNGVAYRLLTSTISSASSNITRSSSGNWASGVIAFKAGSSPSSYTLTADAGSFTLTGAAAGLTAQRVLSASAGSFGLTGEEAFRDFAMAALAGSFSLTGSDATLTYTPASSYTLTAEAGSFTLTGSDVTLAAGRAVTAEAGSFTLTGADAGLAYGRKLAAEAGSYTLTGSDVSFQVHRVLSAESGAITLTGADATLTYTPVSSGAYTLLAEAGSFSLTGAVSGLYPYFTPNELAFLEAYMWDVEIENGLTARQFMRIMAAVLAGKVSGANTSTETFIGLDGVTERVVSASDSVGNRIAVTLNGD